MYVFLILFPNVFKAEGAMGNLNAIWVQYSVEILMTPVLSCVPQEADSMMETNMQEAYWGEFLGSLLGQGREGEGA